MCLLTVDKCQFRDKRAMHNFSVIWKVWEDSRNKWEAKRAHKPDSHPRGGGARPTCRANHALSHRSCLHRLWGWILIIDQGRFDPRVVVLPRGLYKQGP
jgi:hypothetical protein